MSPADLATIERALSALAVSEAAAVSAAEALGALRRRDWVGRTLDEFGRQNDLAPPYVQRDAEQFFLDLAYRYALPHARYISSLGKVYGATEDAARLAAALAVFPTLDAKTRADLGECP